MMDDVTSKTSRPEEKLHPELRSFATTDAAFTALVVAGIASAKVGPNRSLDDVDDEIRGSLLNS